MKDIKEKKPISLYQAIFLTLWLTVTMPVCVVMMGFFKLVWEFIKYNHQYNYMQIFEYGIQRGALAGATLGILSSITFKILGERSMRERRRKSAEMDHEAEKSSDD